MHRIAQTRLLTSHPHRPLFMGTSTCLLLTLFFFLSTVSPQTPPTPAQETPSAAAPATPQTPPAPTAATPAPPADPKAELSIQDSGTTFKLRVNLVQVHVTVRDNKGQPVGNLRKEDFLLYDQGKLQQISTFAMETRQTRRAKAEAAAKTQVDEPVEADKPGAAQVIPDRFVGLVFDDTHFNSSDITYVRVEVGKFLDTLAPTDRAAIYTTSGQLSHGFTSDKEELKKTLLGLVPRAKFPHDFTQCPDVTHYEADQILNMSNDNVFNVDVEDTVQCAFNGDESQRNAAINLTRMAAQRVLVEGDTESQYVYSYLQDVVSRLASKPGERVLVFVSPGFLLTTQTLDMSHIVDIANRSGIVVNTIDGRGLYTPDVMGDISVKQNYHYQTAGQKASYRIEAQSANSYVLGDLAYGTGGTFFQNSNDLAGGLEMVGGAPEVSYVLGFSPASQKMDGQFHALKVSLSDKRKYTIQARRGYYAPKKFNDAEQQAREEIQEAVFSRDEILDLPLQLQTQFFKTDDSTVHLSVVSRLQIQGVHFRKAGGRNFDNLTLATVLFDDNGNFVTGQEKFLTMKLLDTTYEKLLRSGITVKSTFDVKPGKYMIRLVVRDSEGSQMAARNGAVDIPY